MQQPLEKIGSVWNHKPRIPVLMMQSARAVQPNNIAPHCLLSDSQRAPSSPVSLSATTFLFCNFFNSASSDFPSTAVPLAFASYPS